MPNRYSKSHKATKKKKHSQNHSSVSSGNHCSHTDSNNSEAERVNINHETTKNVNFAYSGNGANNNSNTNLDHLVVPNIIDVVITLPDSKQVEIRSLSTDTVGDLRNSLADHIAYCHETNYSFRHERYENYLRNKSHRSNGCSSPTDAVEGNGVPDEQEIAFLKPYHLFVHNDAYDYESAIINVRRVLDLVSCTTFMGQSFDKDNFYNDDYEDYVEEQSANTSRDSVNGRKIAKHQVMKIEDVGNTQKLSNKNYNSKNSASGDQESNHNCKKCVTEEALVAGLAEVDEESEFGLWKPPRLGDFYKFFSMQKILHDDPNGCGKYPLIEIQWLKDLTTESDASYDEDDFFVLDVSIYNVERNGNISLSIVGCKQGFYVDSSNKSQRKNTLKHSLLHVLRCECSTFRESYASLLQRFTQRNAWGNIPAGLRSNTWLVPPGVVGDNTTDIDQNRNTLLPLPIEDPVWNGNDGGHYRQFCVAPNNEIIHQRDWRQDFQRIAMMNGDNCNDRILRDRRCFLLHQLFTDAAGIHGTNLIIERMESGANFAKTIDNMNITITPAEPILRRPLHNCNIQASDSDTASTSSSEEELLSGLTSDENTVAQNVDTLASVVVHHCGFVASIKAVDNQIKSQHSDLIDVEDEPYVKNKGANAFNIHSLRTMLPGADTESAPFDSCENATRARDIFCDVLDANLSFLDTEELPRKSTSTMRWELGANWAMHIMNQPDDSNTSNVDRVQNVQSIKKTENRFGDSDSDSKLCSCSDSEKSCIHPELSAKLTQKQLKRLLQLSDRYQQLYGKNKALHLQSLEELMASARMYQYNIALPQLVSDFGSLELSPVDGKTLTEFLHSRGINMHSLGDIAKQADGLLHVKMLCIQEMVVRTLKHLFRMMMSKAMSNSNTAPAGNQKNVLKELLSFALNVVFSRLEAKNVKPSNEDCTKVCLNRKLWNWICRYIAYKFGYSLDDDDEKNCQQYRKFIRPLSLLRNLCNKVGITLRTKDYNFNLANLRQTSFSSVNIWQDTENFSDVPKSTFDPNDVICLVPIIKHCQYTSSDGRALLESSKTNLDKGVLDVALNDALAAVKTMKLVCGCYHRHTAVAMSLMAVVMYHTGDFAQAAVYQQRALQTNEREYGLDHPDTIKSYGDLAVFYYRLQHTKLAIIYVHRALYLLHISCGPSHPNTAATLINLAMMMEGLGAINGALRYLHEALITNTTLLGVNHVQTAASYHAIAIALSLLDPPAYALSVQHELTTLNILEAELGPEDIRTIDANAWLEYFETKLSEFQHAKQFNIKKMPDANIASKGHLHVEDLLKFINDKQQEQHVNVVAKLASESRNLEVDKSATTEMKLECNNISTLVMDEDIWIDNINCDEQNLEVSFPVNEGKENGTNKDIGVQHQENPHLPLKEVDDSHNLDNEDDESGWQSIVSRSRKDKKRIQQQQKDQQRQRQRRQNQSPKDHERSTKSEKIRTKNIKNDGAENKASVTVCLPDSLSREDKALQKETIWKKRTKSVGRETRIPVSKLDANGNGEVECNLDAEIKVSGAHGQCVAAERSEDCLPLRKEQVGELKREGEGSGDSMGSCNGKESVQENISSSGREMDEFPLGTELMSNALCTKLDANAPSFKPFLKTKDEDVAPKCDNKGGHNLNVYAEAFVPSQRQKDQQHAQSNFFEELIQKGDEISLKDGLCSGNVESSSFEHQTSTYSRHLPMIEQCNGYFTESMRTLVQDTDFIDDFGFMIVRNHHELRTMTSSKRRKKKNKVKIAS